MHVLDSLSFSPSQNVTEYRDIRMLFLVLLNHIFCCFAYFLSDSKLIEYMQIEVLILVPDQTSVAKYVNKKYFDRKRILLNQI